MAVAVVAMALLVLQAVAVGLSRKPLPSHLGRHLTYMSVAVAVVALTVQLVTMLAVVVAVAATQAYTAAARP